MPIVEENPFEGMLTNAIGTRNVADACRAAGVAAMVQISTDKAVNPTSIMGASKRVAESYCQALDIAGLGDGIHRKVKTYSHGMKQRLAIAQAMLGLPELLVLDEPTDGLDPPQIAEMRKVLRRYAADGRAVLVSSHLLAEVEQTCTDVVVMHKGEIVAAGPVDEIVGDSPTVHLDVSDVDKAEDVLDKLAIRSVAWSR